MLTYLFFAVVDDNGEVGTLPEKCKNNDKKKAASHEDEESDPNNGKDLINKKLKLSIIFELVDTCNFISWIV